MRIVADENIPLLDAFFADFGDIRRLPGRSIDRAAVADADILLVRSVTPVTREMLEGSPVRFVGTCTIGTDHLGAGQVGGRLVTVLKALGWNVLVCDPPRASAEGEGFVSLDEIIRRCDVISLHTPLTSTGELPTWHLFDEARLRQLRQGAWLINASRGAVVDNAALHDVLLDREDLQAVLDVWEGEPQVNVALADLCVTGTPHIAGYSLDGRQRGTAVSLDADTDPMWALTVLCRGVYDPRRDDADFRRSLTGDTVSQRLAFDALRKHYPPRREIDALKVRLEGESEALAQIVTALGAVRV